MTNHIANTGDMTNHNNNIIIFSHRGHSLNLQEQAIKTHNSVQ